MQCYIVYHYTAFQSKYKASSTSTSVSIRFLLVCKFRLLRRCGACCNRHACFICTVLFLAPVVLRVVNVDRAGSAQWVNFSTADLGNRDGDSISFLVLPENIANLSSCPTAIVSGALAGLHQVLPQYSNFSAPASNGEGSEGRILSGLWLVALFSHSRHMLLFIMYHLHHS